MKLELAILAGDESKRFLAELTKQLDRMEKLKGKSEDEEEPEEEDVDDAADEDEEESAPPKKKKKAAVTVDDAEAEEDDSEDTDADEEDADEEEELAPKKKPGRPAKAPKMSADDMNVLCAKFAKAHGGETGIAKVKKILKDNFQVKSLKDVDEDDYPKLAKLVELKKKKAAEDEDDE